LIPFLFFVAAGAALAGALGVVLSRHPVHAALYLVMTLVSVAVLFLIQDAELLAAVQVIVYASAIVVLFLFVIMLLGVDRQEAMTDRIPYQRPAAIALGIILLAELVFLGGHEWATGQETASGVPIEGGGFGGNVERVARVLFTDFLWAFEITAVLLVIAVVGAVVLARRSGQKAEPLDATDGAGDATVGTESGDGTEEVRA
jgi:NADH-quinone oxidoreductase subunit J